jgi:catechol 2,3-dioxygenase
LRIVSLFYLVSYGKTGGAVKIHDANYPLREADVGYYYWMVDGNGVELYWDRPKGEWPVDEAGNLQMVTEFLDLEDLLRELSA